MSRATTSAMAATELAPLATSMSSHDCGELIGGDLVADNLADDEISPVKPSPCPGSTDRWAPLTHGPRLSVPLCRFGVKERGEHSK
jgi:hypothetical protein